MNLQTEVWRQTVIKVLYSKLKSTHTQPTAD